VQTLFWRFKKYCQDLLKTCNEKLELKGHAQGIFEADLIAFAFVGVSLSDVKSMGRESI